MKRNANLNDAIANNYSHLWSGSIDIHNLHDRDFIKKHNGYTETILNNLADRAELDNIRNEVLNKFEDKYSTNKRGKRVWNSTTDYNEYVDYLNNEFSNYAISLVNGATIFTQKQSNEIFNATMVKAGELAKKYKVTYPGFRFAINGGRSINNKSISVNTWPFLVKDANKSYDEQINDCLNMFKFYIWHYSAKARSAFDDYKMIA